MLGCLCLLETLAGAFYRPAYCWGRDQCDDLIVHVPICENSPLYICQSVTVELHTCHNLWSQVTAQGGYFLFLIICWHTEAKKEVDRVFRLSFFAFQDYAKQT